MGNEKTTMMAAINRAYQILCSGDPPFSARETNARRVLRQAGATIEGKEPERPTERTRNHFYRDVPRLGHVAVSRHAQAQMIDAGITQEAFDKALLEPTRPDVPEGPDIVWRERDGLRIVVLMNPTPNTGARLVKTVYRVERQMRATR